MNRRTIAKSILLKALPHEKALDDLPDVVGLSIDSRTIMPKDIFFAIKGELADGHDFIEEAHKKGASLIIAERAHEKVIVKIVEDPLQFYSCLASMHLETLDVIKIAITGSNGKTTTKEMVKAALSNIFGDAQVFASAGNQNNHFGIPLSALSVTSDHKIAIFEMGMNHEQEIASHCQVVKPHFGIITNISMAHEGNFADGILGVAKAKGELFEFLAEHAGTAIVNNDDARIKALSEKLNLKSITVGHGACDVQILSAGAYSPEKQAQEVKVSVRLHEISFLVPMLGQHHAQNAGLAIALILALGLDVKKGAEGIFSMEKTSGRMNISHTSKGFLVVNDGYNANPASMKAGILASAELFAKRRIAVIGAMGELGKNSVSHHRDLGKLLASHFDALFICGKDGIHCVEAAKEQGFLAITYKETSVELVEPLKQFLASGDLVFIKGSLSANMKAVADALKD